MSGMFIGLAVALLLTLISVGSIWFSRRVGGTASIGIINAGMLMKLMMGGSLSLAVFKFADVNLLAYAVTLGVYVCSVLPILAYFLVRKDMTIANKIKTNTIK